MYSTDQFYAWWLMSAHSVYYGNFCVFLNFNWTALTEFMVDTGMFDFSCSWNGGHQLCWPFVKEFLQQHLHAAKLFSFQLHNWCWIRTSTHNIQCSSWLHSSTLMLMLWTNYTLNSRTYSIVSNDTEAASTEWRHVKSIHVHFLVDFSTSKVSVHTGDCHSGGLA
jgi:hypothetical protein